MAYYSSSYYMNDYGREYNGHYSLTSYDDNIDPSPVQDSSPYYCYIPNDYQNFTYDSVPFFASYDHPVSSHSTVGYSVASYSEPKYIRYRPAPRYSERTRFIVSYSVSEDTDFEEYDPTPYGGGYDQILTYGKPLPPSDETCYPRSAPLNGVSSDPVVKEVADEEHAAKPESESKPTSIQEAGHQLDKPQNLYQGEESKENNGDDRSSSSGYDNGSRVEDGYEYERQVAQIPPGYGLEAMDLCEGLFGYWPCLSRYRKRWSDCQDVAPDCGNYGNQWKGTADYLFGNLNPYDGRRADDIGGSHDGYVDYADYKHYQQQLYHQVDDS